MEDQLIVPKVERLEDVENCELDCEYSKYFIVPKEELSNQSTEDSDQQIVNICMPIKKETILCKEIAELQKAVELHEHREVSTRCWTAHWKRELARADASLLSSDAQTLGSLSPMKQTTSKNKILHQGSTTKNILDGNTSPALNEAEQVIQDKRPKTEIDEQGTRKAQVIHSDVSNSKQNGVRDGIEVQLSTSATSDCGSKKYDLTRHLESHTGEKLCSCQHCQFKSSLSGHITHNEDKRFSCTLCHKKFGRKPYLTIHMKTHTNEKRFHCNICNKKFTSKIKLTYHTRIHSGEKPYSCDQCQKKFTLQSSLINHNMRTHTGVKPFSCYLCQKKFAQNDDLNRHMTIHTGEKPYSCDQCQAKFGRKSTLTTHMKTHTGEKPYSCDQCKGKFSLRNTLINHMRSHTGEKPYSCNQCNANFTRKYHKVAHMRFHTGEKPYSCDQCQRKFTQRNTFIYHMRTHAGDKPYSCDQCTAKFAKKQHLDNHMRTHAGEKSFSCNLPPT